VWPPELRAQRQEAGVDAQAPLLTLDDAVSLALKSNRLVKNSALEVEKSNFRVNQVRTRRLPNFQLGLLGGSLLQPFDFTFPAGAFGTFPSTGPIPAKNTGIRTPAQFVTYATAAAAQPVTQQYKIHLSIVASKLGREIAGEDLRAERQKVAAEVRDAYFNLVATQTGVEAARQNVSTLQEAQQLTSRYRAQETVLRADALEVDARLAKAAYELSVVENGLVTQRERLNQLLGRDIATAFRVESFPEEEATGLTLEEARRRAAQNRPEVREAQLKAKQAEVDRRFAKAEYIPDLSLVVQYFGANNVQILPTNVAVAGFFFNWEPFDWGRKRNTVAEKSKAVDQAHNGVQETQAQVAVEVGQKYRKWQESVLLLKAARTGHDAATEQFRVTANMYRQQASLLKDLLQAQAASSEANYNYQQALSSHWSALADLRRAMGEE
jgi:outer membrane protein TolC